MVKGNPTIIFSLNLTKRAVAIWLKGRGGRNLHVQCFRVSTRMVFPSFSYIQSKKKKNLIVEIPKGRWVHQTLFQDPEVYVISFLP